MVGDHDIGFSQNGTKNDISEEFVCIDVIPPLPIKKNAYMCDKYFHIEFIEDLYKSYDDYGIVLIAGEETQFYKLNGTQYNMIDNFTLCRQKKQKNGGQSSARFQRIHDNQISEYVKKICERLTSNYIDKTNRANIKGLIIAGIGDIKDKVVGSDWLHPKLVEIMSKVINITQLDIERVIQLSDDVINNNEMIEQNKIIDKFYEVLIKDSNKVIYGIKTINEYIHNGLIKELLVHGIIKDSIKEILDEAESLGCTINYVNVMNEKTKQLLNGYGGILGITWYTYDDYSNGYDEKIDQKG